MSKLLNIDQAAERLGASPGSYGDWSRGQQLDVSVRVAVRPHRPTSTLSSAPGRVEPFV